MSTHEETAPAPVAGQGGRSLARLLALTGLGLAVILVLVLIGAAYAGYNAGVAQRTTAYQSTQVAELENQYNLGLEDLAAGRYVVAVARFEYVLQLDPHYRDANVRLAEARAALQAANATPTGNTPAASPTPRPTRAATSTPAGPGEAAALFAQAEDAYAAGDWSAVIDLLARAHAADPDYEAIRADGLLYVAYRNRGIERILGDELEGGIFDLDKAQAFGPLDTEALQHRAWARLYLAASGYWGLDWRQAMLILQQLHLIAPYFHDTTPRLFEATRNYAAQLEAAGDYCGAAEHYAAALAVQPSDAVAESLAQAQTACAENPAPGEGEAPEGEATPTPEAGTQGNEGSGN